MGHTRLTHGYLMEKGENPRYISCETKLTVNHLIIEFLQYIDEHRNKDIFKNLRNMYYTI